MSNELPCRSRRFGMVAFLAIAVATVGCSSAGNAVTDGIFLGISNTVAQTIQNFLMPTG